VRVVVGLALPPLSLRGGRGLASFSARSKLDVASTSSRAYLRLLGQKQARVAAQIRASIPQARIGRHFLVVLDGLTVSLPASQLPKLLRQKFVTKVYPSVTYTLALDRSPSVIGADVLQRKDRRRRAERLDGKHSGECANQKHSFIVGWPEPRP